MPYHTSSMRMPKSKPNPPKRKNKPKMEKVELGGEEVEFKEGTLRNQLKVPKDMKLTPAILKKINKANVGEMFDFNGRKIKMTPLMKKRITLGINLQKRKK